MLKAATQHDVESVSIQERIWTLLVLRAGYYCLWLVLPRNLSPFIVFVTTMWSLSITVMATGTWMRARQCQEEKRCGLHFNHSTHQQSQRLGSWRWNWQNTETCPMYVPETFGFSSRHTTTQLSTWLMIKKRLLKIKKPWTHTMTSCLNSQYVSNNRIATRKLTHL